MENSTQEVQEEPDGELDEGGSDRGEPQEGGQMEDLIQAGDLIERSEGNENYFQENPLGEHLFAGVIEGTTGTYLGAIGSEQEVVEVIHLTFTGRLAHLDEPNDETKQARVSLTVDAAMALHHIIVDRLNEIFEARKTLREFFDALQAEGALQAELSEGGE